MRYDGYNARDTVRTGSSQQCGVADWKGRWNHWSKHGPLQCQSVGAVDIPWVIIRG